MIRKDQIKDAASRMFPKINMETDAAWAGFVHGAEWADLNPWLTETLCMQAAMSKIKKYESRIKELEDGMVKIIGRSHSWVITESTVQIEKPIHDGYRAIASSALGLAKIREMK